MSRSAGDYMAYEHKRFLPKDRSDPITYYVALAGLLLCVDRWDAGDYGYVSCFEVRYRL